LNTPPLPLIPAGDCKHQFSVLNYLTKGISPRYKSMSPSANEISQRALSFLAKSWPQPSRFQDMADGLGFDDKDLSKNLFWLEEHRLVKLSTSLPAGSTFPTIIVVRLTPEGEEVAADPARLERRFPSPSALITRQGPLTYRRAMEKLRDYIETLEGMEPERRHDLLRCVDELLALDKIDIPIAG